MSAWNLSLLADGIPIAIAAVRSPNADLIASLGAKLLNDEALAAIKVFLLLDEAADIFDLEQVCWLACANIAPERDIRLADAPRRQIVVDACMKHPGRYNFPREWPNVVTASETTINTVDQKWEQLGLGKFRPSPSLKFLKMKQGDGAVAINS